MGQGRGMAAGGRSICVWTMLALVVAFVSTAQAATLRVPVNILAEPGESIYVPVTLDNASGVLGYYFELDYDPTVLEYVQTENGNLIPGTGWSTPEAYDVPGQVSVAGLGSEPLSGTGSLVVVHFQVQPFAANEATSPLDLGEAELNDGAIPVSTQDGQVTVVAIVEMRVPAHLTRKPGDSLAVPVIVDDAAGAYGYYFEFTFNNAVLEYVGAQVGGLTSEWGGPVVHDALDGHLSVAGLGPTAVTGAGSLAVLEFRVRDTAEVGQTSPLEFGFAEINDGAIGVVAHDGLIEVTLVGLPLAVWPLLLVLFAAGTLAVQRRVEAKSALTEGRADVTCDERRVTCREGSVTCDGGGLTCGIWSFTRRRVSFICDR